MSGNFSTPPLSQDQIVKLYCKAMLKKHKLRVIPMSQLPTSSKKEQKIKTSQSSVTGPEISQMISTLNSNILKQLGVESVPPVFSPFSIFYAMILLYLGSNKQTKKEIQKTLGIGIGDPQLIIDLGLLKNVSNYASPKRGPLGTGPPVKIVNSNVLIIKSGYPIEKNYLDIFVKVTGGKLIPFQNPHEAITKTNTWVAQKTFNLIPRLLGEGDVNQATRLILLNVIYFRAQWQHPFQQVHTYKDQFYSLTKVKNLDFMHQTDYYQYSEDQNMQYIQLPYTDNDYLFFIALPKATLSQTVNRYGKWGSKASQKGIDLLKLSLDNIQWKATNVKLSLPKFEHRNRIDLAKIFKKMGIIDLFSNNANLEMISKNSELAVDKIIHEAIVKVDEKGTEAAAATALVMKSMAMMPPKNLIEMNVNKTFYYSIIWRGGIKSREGHPQNYILFSGIFDG